MKGRQSLLSKFVSTRQNGFKKYNEIVKNSLASTEGVYLKINT